MYVLIENSNNIWKVEGNDDGWVREKCLDKVKYVETLQCVKDRLIATRRSLKAGCGALHGRWAPRYAQL